jgi:hypothetical protein
LVQAWRKEELMTATKGLGLGLVMVMALALGASGCALFNRGTMHYSRTTTVGRELVDLKDALDKGVVTEDEYAKAKKDILEGGPVKFEASCKATK